MFIYARRNNTGLTLVEMLLALTLSVILISNYFRLYIFVRKNYQQQSGLIYVQQNIRLLAGILSSEVHHTGLPGIRYYFIDKTARLNPDGKVVYALYRKQGHHPKVEMLENIQMLKMNYDQIVNNHLIRVDKLNIDQEIVGVAFHYLLRDPTGLISKSGYLYVAIRKKRHRTNNGIDHAASYNADEPFLIDHKFA